jgi:VWFA-related protein
LQFDRYKPIGAHAVATNVTTRIAVLMLAAVFFAGPARAAVDLRVEAIPISAPIQAFVTVTDANGDPVGGLDVNDFTVILDGTMITIPPADFTLPPAQDPNQRVSVVFAMDYSESVQDAALTAMQQAVMTFINTMNEGDFAAIVKFTARGGQSVASVVQPFTEIDDGGTGDVMLTSAVMAPFEVGRTNLFDGITISLEQFSAPPTALPAGPKAVIVISDGEDNASEIASEFSVIADATENSIPIFLIGVGTFAGEDLMTRLASETGGEYFSAPDDPEIAAAYVTISERLNNEYLLSIVSTITNCNDHTLQVSVTNQASPASATFARCAPQPPPPPPPTNGGGSGGGGGGGTVGTTLLLAGLVALAAGRRRPRGAR